jgi:hypothetical protein
MRDKIYLDARVNYDYLTCISAATACVPVSSILPHLFFTMNL